MITKETYREILNQRRTRTVLRHKITQTLVLYTHQIVIMLVNIPTFRINEIGMNMMITYNIFPTTQ